jgi:hypothetical protein
MGKYSIGCAGKLIQFDQTQANLKSKKFQGKFEKLCITKHSRNIKC